MRQILTRQFFASVALMSMLMVAAHSVWAASAPKAEAVIKQTTNKMLEALEDNPDNVYALVEEIVLPNFDFCKMSRLVLGKKGKKAWKRASKAQKDRFVNAFRELLVRTYSAALVEAAGRLRGIDYSSRKRGSKKATVKTKVRQRGGSPIKVDYAMYRPNKKNRRKCSLSRGWKVYNVKVAGSSLVATYRNEFKEYLRIGGMNYLIEKLEEKKE